MFKLLRSNAKFFYWIIAGSFVLFIFLAWGMQYSGRQTGGGPRDVGSINGQKISAEEWDSTYQRYMAYMRQQAPDRTLTPNQMAQASENIWQQLLRMKLEAAEIDDRGIKVSDQDILDVLRNNPPAELLQQYVDENGQVDREAYLRDLADPNRDWTQVEAYLRETIPRTKLYEQIVSDVTVTDEELREEYVNQNGRAVAEYVGVLLRDVDDPAEPEETEIEAWYNGHLDDYVQPGRINLRMVTFSKEATEEDREEILSLALDVRNEILSGELDFAEAAAIYSEDSTRDSGGDLGVFDRNRMEAPFTEAAFSQPVGEVGEPVETRYGFHLIEVLDQEKENGEVVRVHARHILFPIVAGEITLADVYDAASLFAEDAAEQGFAEAAAADSLEIVTPESVFPGRDIPGYSQTANATLFAAGAKPNTIGRVMQNDQMYFVVQALEPTPEGPAPLDEVRNRVVRDLQNDRRMQAAKARINPALGALQMGEDFAAVAERFDLVHAVTDTFTAMGNIDGVGYNTDFNKKAIAAPVDEIVTDITTNRGVFALKTLWKWELDPQAFAEQAPALRQRMIGLRQQQALEDWFAEQMEKADIEDNRAILMRAGS